MKHHKSLLIHRALLLVAKWIVRQDKHWMENPVAAQEKGFQYLLAKGKISQFGKDHGFSTVKTYDDFKKAVPVRDYEGLKKYFDRVRNGEKDILWPGKPIYLCTTSGTTSGTKYIPVTRASMPNFIRSTRNALLHYINNTGNTSVVDGKFIFIQGSPVLDTINGIKTGRLSGIVAHHVPFYLQRNRKPSFATNSIDDWEKKIEAIVDETMDANMTAFAGIPPWVQMYFESLLKRSGKQTIGALFPNLTLLVSGGVNFDPYKKTFDALIGRPIDRIDMYPASEGFFAYQDTMETNDLLLLLNENIFYEFIRAEEVFGDNPERINIGDVKLGVNYALVVNSSAGLWGYLIGDTVQFTSLKPYRIRVTGRIAHFISAFGEHVIGEEVDASIHLAMEAHHCTINEFSVAPQVNPPAKELPYHEWFIEFNNPPDDLEAFCFQVDKHLQDKNSYYKHLVQGKILQPLKITPLRTGGFKAFMEERGKLGGQNKVPRLSNDREIAAELEKYRLNS